MANTEFDPAEAVAELIKWAKKRSAGIGNPDFDSGYDAAQDAVLDIIDEAGGFAE